MTQEAPEIEDTHKATQGATQEDIQEISEEDCAKEGGG